MDNKTAIVLAIVTHAGGKDYLILQDRDDHTKSVRVRLKKKQAEKLRCSGLLYGD